MKYAELTPGRVISSGTYAVTEEEILAFARQYDPQPFHIDREQAARTRWKGLIASGFHTCAMAMRLFTTAVLQDSESIGSPGLDYVKWLHPVRPGDALTLTATVLEAKPSKSGTVGAVRMRWQLFNQSGIAVLDLTATSLFDLQQTHIQ